MSSAKTGQEHNGGQNSGCVELETSFYILSWSCLLVIRSFFWPDLEDVLVEVLLEALVGEIDAQLLEAVDGEWLKAVDVQDPDDSVHAVSVTWGSPPPPPHELRYDM
jgi:hypothetical protein